MLRSLWLTAIYLGFLGIGTSAPFVLTLGYLWVDTFQPQNVSWILLKQVPVAMIMVARPSRDTSCSTVVTLPG